PEHWDQHEATELAYLEAEETRLLYVAATRARDLLVISCYAGSTRATRSWERFAPWLAGVPELPAPGEPAIAARALGALGPEARAGAEVDGRAAYEKAARPSWAVESVTATAHRAGSYGRPLQAGRTREPDTGIAWGTLVHALLEHAMRGPRRDRAHLGR